MDNKSLLSLVRELMSILNSTCFRLKEVKIVYAFMLNASRVLTIIFCLVCLIINRREAIAEAIIGFLLIFYNSKNLNCIGALSV